LSQVWDILRPTVNNIVSFFFLPLKKGYVWATWPFWILENFILPATMIFAPNNHTQVSKIPTSLVGILRVKEQKNKRRVPV